MKPENYGEKLLYEIDCIFRDEDEIFNPSKKTKKLALLQIKKTIELIEKGKSIYSSSIDGNVIFLLQVKQYIDIRKNENYKQELLK